MRKKDNANSARIEENEFSTKTRSSKHRLRFRGRVNYKRVTDLELDAAYEDLSRDIYPKNRAQEYDT